VILSYPNWISREKKVQEEQKVIKFDHFRVSYGYICPTARLLHVVSVAIVMWLVVC
jgi:hypothetical protein